jgi:formylmethanofuran dehydrogenase subunit A
VLFTRAVAHRAPRVLARATRESLAAVPLLDAAALGLAGGR